MGDYACVLAPLGDHDASLAAADEGLEIVTRTGHRTRAHEVLSVRIKRARCLLEAGRSEPARTELDAALPSALQLQSRHLQGEIYLLQSRLLLDQDLDAARALTEEAERAFSDGCTTGQEAELAAVVASIAGRIH